MQEHDGSASPITPDDSMRFEDISEPGTYVCHWNGDLLRITGTEVPESLESNPATAPAGEPCRVTRVSPDPYVPISVARMAAANLDLEISF